MSAFSHRQRVLTAIQHQEPDRIPMDLMGQATMLLDQTYLRLRDFLGLSPIPPARSGSTANYYDERILAFLDIDFRRVMLPSHPQAEPQYQADGSFLDAWGIGFKTEGMYVNVVHPPLANAVSVQEVETYPWPQADTLYHAQGLREHARQLFETTDYAIVARNPLTYGLFDRACLLMGNARFMMTMVENPPLAHALLERILTVYKDVWSLFLEAVGDFVHMVEYGDDLGGQNNLLISPAMYRTFLKPREAELFSLMRRKAPHAAIFRHCDGSIRKIIPDFIEIGIDVLNPVQTSAKDMDGKILKESFGAQLTFHGAIEKMDSDRDTLLTEVKEKIDTFAPGGGYIFSSCNHMINVPPENILLMFETARQYGKYPRP